MLKCYNDNLLLTFVFVKILLTTYLVPIFLSDVFFRNSITTPNAEIINALSERLDFGGVCLNVP
jgi:hypothetical protein